MTYWLHFLLSGNEVTQGGGKDGSTPPQTVLLGAHTGPLSNHVFSIPCHCGLVERANHREKHILLISPSHCWFSQESLPSRPHANLLIWLSMVALTVLWFPSSDRHLRGPKARSLPSSPESIHGSCSSLTLDFRVSQMLCARALLLLGYSEMSKKRALVTTSRHY